MKKDIRQFSFSPAELDNFFSYDVYDRSEKHAGNVTGLWTDDRGLPQFLGIKSTWIFGKTHLVPLENAYIDAEEGDVYLAYDEDRIKDAPSFDPDAELSEADELAVYRHYGLNRATQQASYQQTQQRASTPPVTGQQQVREGTTMQLREEHLNVGKREVPAGQVRLRKIVRSEQVNQPVELKREEVVIERVPATDVGRASDAPFETKEQVINLKREEPVVSKETQVREGVRVQKRTETERSNVSDTVRKEDVEVLQGTHSGEARIPDERMERERIESEERLRREREGR